MLAIFNNKKIEHDVKNLKIGNENANPCEFNIHARVIYDYLSIVVVHFAHGSLKSFLLAK
jgi:hypothetical protein